LKPGRNDPCGCGSGKKHKKCCGQAADNPLPQAEIHRLADLLSARLPLELEAKTRELLPRYPRSGLLWKVLGLALWMQGKDALHALQRAIELSPDDAEAHGNLGNALRAAGQLERAVESQRRALGIKPDYAEAHNDLGSAQQDLGRLDEALGSFRRAIAIRSDFALAHCNLAHGLMLQNRPLDAEVSCRRALQIDPRLTTGIVQLAELQAGKGRFGEAEDLLKRAIAVEPDMPEAWAALVRFRKMGAGDAAWLEQAQRLAARRLAPRQEVFLRYALGKYFDDLGEPEQAFSHYRRANELAKLHRTPHDRRQFRLGVDRIMRNFDGGWIARQRPAGSPSDRPVFIVGMPRSGTTLAEQILASHPEVFGAGELRYWNEAAPLYAARLPGERDAEVLRRLSDGYLSSLSALSSDARRVVDKMPANFLYLGLIHAALPHARIIHMRRNPLDTCLSIYFQNFEAPHSYANDLEDLAQYYGEYRRLMDHWRAGLAAEAMLEVPYEGLVEDPQGWSRRMVEFIGLPWDEACLQFHRNSRTVGTFSKWQARQKISKSSVDRWRKYEQFIAPLLQLAPLVTVSA